MDSQQILGIIKLIWPLALLQFGLQVYCVIDIVRRNRTRNLSVPIWLVIVIFGEILGSIIYLIIGRSEE